MTLKKDKSTLWDKAPSHNTLIGYQDVRQQLIEEFFSRTKAQENRLVRIIGFAGVGKSALARHTVNYVQERGFTDGGCIFVDCN